MKVAVKQVIVVLMGAWLALVLLGSKARAQSVSVSVGSQFSPNPVSVGPSTAATASASATATPPTAPPYCTLSGPSWSWSVDGPSGVSVEGNGPSATVTANIGTAGTYSITATATATWSDSCGGFYSASGSVTFNPLTVVEVVSITPLDEVYSTKNIGDTLTKADFSITTNPPGYDDLVTVNPVTVQVGDNIVMATCGISYATTDVIGCQRSGSLSDLIVGPSYSDDSVNFTALIQGCDGEYTVTASGPDAVIDGGDTSGNLTANQSHSGTVYVNATPPNGSGQSRLPILLNGSLAYGLGGISGSAEIKQVNGDGGLTLGILALIAAVGGTGTAAYGLSLSWTDPVVNPGGSVPISITNSWDPQNWNQTTVTDTFTMTAQGKARSSAFGYKYTWNATETLNVMAPTPPTVTYTPTMTVYSACTRAEVTLGSNDPIAQKNAQAGSSATDSSLGKSQIKYGAGVAQLWVGTITTYYTNSWTPYSTTNINISWYGGS